MSTTPVITIYVRHSADCKYKADETSRRCKCRKHLRWTHNGEQHRRKANTRSGLRPKRSNASWRMSCPEVGGIAPFVTSLSPTAIGDYPNGGCQSFHPG